MSERKKQILIAEDEPNISFSLRFLLERNNFDVEETTDGLQVEPRAHSLRPDLIILDIMLPNKSGFEVLAALKRNRSTQSIPVMMLSARGQKADKEHALRLGAVDYIVKPFSNQEIVERVNALVEKNA